MKEDPPRIVTTHAQTPPPIIETPIPTLAAARAEPATAEDETPVEGHPGIIELFEDAEDGWRFRIKGGNGEIVASSESYTRKHDAERGCRALCAILIHPETTVKGFGNEQAE